MSQKYTIRTCFSCGVRKPQPEMKNVVTYLEVGKTRSSVSGSTIAGAFLDDKASKRAVQRAIFNTDEKTLRRKKNVWVCGAPKCMREVSSESSNTAISVISGILLLAFMAYFFGLDRSSSKTTASEAPSSTALSTMPSLAIDDGGVQAPEQALIAEPKDYALPTTRGYNPPAIQETGTCYLKPGTTNVVVTDWHDKTACAANLGLVAR